MYSRLAPARHIFKDSKKRKKIFRQNKNYVGQKLASIQKKKVLEKK